MAKNSFLERLWSRLSARYEEESHSLQLLFPSKNTAMHFRWIIGEERKKSQSVHRLLPYAAGWTEFLSEKTGLEEADGLEAALILYELHVERAKIGGYTARQLTDFMPLARSLIKDFDDIDHGLKDPKKIFLHHADLQEIDIRFADESEAVAELLQRFWKLYREAYSAKKEDYLRLWKDIPLLYTGLNQALFAQGQARLPFLLRKAIANPKAYAALFKGPLFFIGFSSIPVALRAFISHARSEGVVVECHFDLDTYYMEKGEYHEAGKAFLTYRKNKLLVAGSHGLLPPYESSFSSPKTITHKVVDSPLRQATEAARKLSSYLKEMPPDTSYGDIAIILPDPSMLLPLLHALRQADVGHDLKYNVSMSLPLSATPMAAFVESLHELSADIDQHAPAERQRKWEFFLRHPFYDTACAAWYAKGANTPSLSCLKPFFGCSQRFPAILATDFFSVLEAFLGFFISLKDEFSYEQQLYIRSLHKLLRRFVYSRLSTYFDKLKPAARWHFFSRLMDEENIPFEGEFFDSIQITGITQAQSRDFSHLIVLDVNEGLLPSGRRYDSLLPEILRKAYSLPTHEDRDASHAYLFYQMLQRAKNITLFSRSEESGGSNQLSANPISRYVYQLMYDGPCRDADRNHEFLLDDKRSVSTRNQETPLFKASSAPAIASWQQKNENIKTYCCHVGALNTYLRCPLNFYHRQVLKVHPPEPIGDMTNRSLGKVFHDLLYEFYTRSKTCAGKQLHAALQATLEDLAKDKYKDRINKLMSKNDIPAERHLLYYGVMKQQVEAVLRYDCKRLDTGDLDRVLALEKK